MKWFTYEEFNSPDVPGSGHQMRDEFLDKLDLARGIAGVPFRINSGMRSYDHNHQGRRHSQLVPPHRMGGGYFGDDLRTGASSLFKP